VHVGSKFCGTKSLSQNPQVLRKICVFLPSWDRGLAPQNLDTTCTYPASLLGIRFWNSFLEGPDEGLVWRKRQSWQQIHNCASYTFRKEVSAQLLFPYKLYLSLVTAIFLHENEVLFLQPNNGTRMVGTMVEPLGMALHRSSVSCVKLLIQV
jgi:hypothetical protein